jgi:hypothetical protein
MHNLRFKNDIKAAASHCNMLCTPHPYPNFQKAKTSKKLPEDHTSREHVI